MKMQSEQIDQLAAALAIAQGQITGALKDSANPFYKSKYADLASVWDACRGPLSENGLAVIQTTEADGIAVVTTLAHKSGQWISGTLRMTPKDNSPQAAGSCLTYARRYALAAIVGVAQVDDDGNAATNIGHIKASPRDDMGTEDVDTEIAEQYAVAMIAALDFPAKALELHGELIGDQAMYVVASDIAQRNRKGFRSAWRALVSKKEVA